jgi:hypothetical protein
LPGRVVDAHVAHRSKSAHTAHLSVECEVGELAYSS